MSRMNLGVDTLRKATQAHVLMGGDVERVEAISTDSRKVSSGDLFVALRGDRFDAHSFVPSVVSKGVGAVIVETERWEDIAGEVEGTAWVLGVPDSLKALGALARHIRREWGGRVVGITGSAGKTTTKELVGAALTSLGDVHLTPGNWNNQIGLPLTLFALGNEKVAVLEMGTSEPGEIAALAAIAEPDVALITNVGPAHLEGLGSLEGVAREKGALFAALKPHHQAVVNVDDPRVKDLSESLSCKCITYGFDPSADLCVLGVEPLENGVMKVTLRAFGEEFAFPLDGLGEHMALNAAGAIAAAAAMGVSTRDAIDGIQSFVPPEQRMKVRDVAGVHVLDDSYNSNPTSARAALRAFAGLRGAGRRFVILGDMLELGESAAEHHHALGMSAAQLPLDGLITVGEHSETIVAGAKAAGALFEMWNVSKAEDVLPLLGEQVERGDWVLVKGSRGIRLETVIEGLERGGC